ncbi:hypothetical protein D9M72_463950 [compost metagenome]
MRCLQNFRDPGLEFIRNTARKILASDESRAALGHGSRDQKSGHEAAVVNFTAFALQKLLDHVFLNGDRHPEVRADDLQRLLGPAHNFQILIAPE